jgi:carbon-monoxide dehydrogenase medium subunit
MYSFAYSPAASLQDALSQIGQGGQALAGGQTLIASMKQRLISPEKLIDLAGVKELKGVTRDANTWVIGAMTLHQDVAAHADLTQSIPALTALAGGIGDRQVRAMGTLGGSLANNDPAACYPSAVLALDAVIKTNKREIKSDDFFQGLYATALAPDELIVSVRFPIAHLAGYAKFKQPASRYALVGVFVAKTTTGVRVAITGAANGVFRHAGLEKALTANFSAAAVTAVTVDAADLNSDLHASAQYRAHLIKIQTQRAIQQAIG